MFLIQGFFLQEQSVLGTGYDLEGARAVIETALMRGMFAGAFGMSEGVLEGRMFDCSGDSTLTQISLGHDAFTLVKRYDHHQAEISYTFYKMADGTWKGSYKGEATGTGTAQCVLTKVPDDFLLPKER